MKKLNIIAVALIGTAISANANPKCYDYEHFSAGNTALALALANDMGRLQPLTDLKVEGDRLALTQEGWDACAAHGSTCSKVSKILSYQDDDSHFPAHYFNSVIFRQRLVIQFQRQMIAAARPDTDPTKAGAAPHNMVYTYSTWYDDACNPHFLFDLTPTTSEPVTEEDICSQLIFAGTQGVMKDGKCVSDNPIIDLRVTPNATGIQVAIDPQEIGFNFEGENFTPEFISNNCLVIDESKAIEGYECNCNETTGTFQAEEAGSDTFVCQ
jgi:hypothetical protein